MNKTAHILHVIDSLALAGAERMLIEPANAAGRITDTRNVLSKVGADSPYVVRLLKINLDSQF